VITINTKNSLKEIVIFNIENYKHLIRFAIVGVINTAVDFGIYSLCVGLLHIYYMIAQVLGYYAGIINSFILNKFWTFESREINKKTTGQFIRFIIVNALSFGAAFLGLWLLVDNLSVNKYIAKIITIAISQTINFLGYKLWVFRK